MMARVAHNKFLFPRGIHNLWIRLRFRWLQFDRLQGSRDARAPYLEVMARDVRKLTAIEW